MTSFEKTKMVFVKNFMEPSSVNLLCRYVDNALLQENFERVSNKSATSYGRYGDPMSEIVLGDMLPTVESVTGKELFPTYSYARIYIKGDVLHPHIDRPSCEYSVTVNIDSVGEPWPIWIENSEKKPVKHVLMPGDALVYKGCELKHWREIATNTEVNVQFMLHYVDKNGPFSEFKFDKRSRLGSPRKLRG